MQGNPADVDGVVGDLMDALEDTDATMLYRMLAERLPETIVISIGRAASLAHLHDSILELGGKSPAVTQPAPPLVARA